MSVRFSFKPENRLNTASAFSAVFDQGHRCHLKAGMYIVLQNQLGVARLGLIIAKKKLSRAVKRNYLKRIQRETFRYHQQALKGYDVVFVANHKVAQLCQSDLFEACQLDWQNLVKRLSRP